MVVRMSDTQERELLYVGDPMCSWCWGIAPELDHLTATRSDLPLRIVVGGLRPGPNAAIVDDRMAATLGHHWEAVSSRSGQPFDRSLLEKRGWVYDTEPACRAVVVMRELDETLAWPLFKRLQHLFYAEGVVISDISVYEGIVDEFGVDSRAFLDAFRSEAAVKQTWRDFATARNWGITGFPTLVARDGDRGHLVAAGYQTAEVIAAALDRVLPPTGEMCGPDGVC